MQKQLLKQYGFTSDMQYMEMMVDSYVNGQREQAKQQFLALPKKTRQAVAGVFIFGDWQRTSNDTDLQKFFHNLICVDKGK